MEILNIQRNGIFLAVPFINEFVFFGILQPNILVQVSMSTEKTKSFLLFQHSLSDYIRVAAIAIVVMLAIFIVKLFGGKENNGNKTFRSYNKLTETINLDV
jgi:hypothetical protein